MREEKDDLSKVACQYNIIKKMVKASKNYASQILEKKK